MTIRSARGDGTAVRWAYGVLLTLCVALAVLVHHETPSMDVSSMPDSVHTVHLLTDGTAPSVSGTSVSGTSVPGDLVSGASAHDADDGACAMPGMQHCSTATVGSVQLALPDQAAFDPLVKLRQPAVGRTPGAAAVGRAPPDLSVLSRLRI
ncbi:hypothetical protein M2271_005552 [Streptomyces sp. LBL]|uniref:hypothetical protein n=1 Tax=Streptomyces sp. LBL TaxID=2940562 RepID=UPI002475A0CD|nr:hypothetical protein [Streptomyces sp. LBL]MDH6627723.1 hypothetical protein [Streptomyces sp. LBL]